MDFRIARAARERYGFEDSLFSTDGDAIVMDHASAAGLAERFVDGEGDRERAAPRSLRSASSTSLGIALWPWSAGTIPKVGAAGAGAPTLDESLGSGVVDGSLLAFEAAFPALPVYQDTLTAGEWLTRESSGSRVARQRSRSSPSPRSQPRTRPQRPIGS